MSLNFEIYAQRGHEFVNLVSEELRIRDFPRAGRIARCVFRALRNHLTIEESFHLLAQLPMAMKAVYVDGWKGNVLHQRGDFIQEVLREDGAAAWRDFSSEEEVREGVRAVFNAMAKFISPGEMIHLRSVLPREIKKLLPVSIEV